MIEIRENSDLLSVKHGFIMHQVNNLGVMGAGLALQIKKKWPDVFKAYKEYSELPDWYSDKDREIAENSDIRLIGECLFVNPEGEADDLIVCNVFAQVGIGKTAKTQYPAWKERFQKIKRTIDAAYGENGYLEERGTVHIPYKLGCGLAGGDWDTMKEIIDTEFKDDKHVIVIHKLAGAE